MESTNEIHKAKVNHHEQKDPPISLPDAIERGKKWAALLGELPYFSGNNAKYKPKALFIPYQDLKDLIEHHERNHHHVKGVRVYLGLVPNLTPIAPDPVTYDMRGSVVAVGPDGKDIIRTLGSNYAGDIGDIYDFTAPCPDVCDTSSPLFQMQ